MLCSVDYFTQLPSGGYLIIPSHSLLDMRKYRQKQLSSPESGGILLGSWRSNTSSIDEGTLFHAEVTDNTVPSEEDCQKRFSFLRQSFHHVEYAFSLWKRSNREVSYIGEWHTHPEDNPTPSKTDISQWKSKLKGQKAILIIIGIKSEWIGYWCGRRLYHLKDLTPDNT